MEEGIYAVQFLLALSDLRDGCILGYHLHVLDLHAIRSSPVEASTLACARAVHQ